MILFRAFLSFLLLFLYSDIAASQGRVVQADELDFNYETASPTTLAAAAAGSPFTLTLPSAHGSANQCLVDDGAGNLGWLTPAPASRQVNTTAPLTGGGALTSDLTLAIPASTNAVNGYLSSTDWTTFNAKQPAGNYITALTSDVSATGPGSVAATVNSVGGSSAANVHSAELAANAATSSNTASTIVKRDGSGNFSAGQVTLGSAGLVLSGSSSGTTTLQASATASGTLTLPALTDTMVSRQSTDQGANRLKNKDLSTTSVQFVDSTDTTKELKIDESTATTGTALTLVGGQTANRSVTFPDATGTLVLNSRAINTTSPITGGGDLSADRTIAIPVATTSVNGYLSSTDWTTFNAKVSAARAINTTAPLQGGGDLSADRTLSITQSGTAANGYLSSTDWNTFNNKEPVVTTTAGDLIYRGASADTRLAAGTSTQLLHSGTTPSWSQVSLTADVTGTLPFANGGTNATSASAAFNNLSPMTAAGDIIYGGTAGAGTALPKGTSTQLLHSGTTPSWSAVSLTADVTGTLGIGNGGTGLATTPTDGQLLVGKTSTNSYVQATLTGTTNEINVANGSGTITLSTPQAIGTGSSPTFASLTLSSPLTTGNGGTGVSSVTTSPTATAFAGWDANKNLSANNFIEGYATTATAGTTTTLSVSSAEEQYFTGSTTQQLNLPDTSTLVTGMKWIVVNNSTGVVTVKTTGGTNTVQAMAGSSFATFTVLSTATNAAASWNSSYSVNNAGGGTVTSVALTAPAVFTVSGSPVTTSGTLAIGATGTSGGVTYFDSATTMASSGALTNHGVVLGGGAGGAPTSTAVGTNGQLLIGNTSAAPTWGNSVSAATTFSGVLTASGTLLTASCAKSADYTITDTDGCQVTNVTTGSTTRTITLPAAANNTGRTLVITKGDSGTGDVTVTRAGSDTIAGDTSYTLAGQYSRITLASDGSALWTVSAYAAAKTFTSQQYSFGATAGTATQTATTQNIRVARTNDISCVTAVALATTTTNAGTYGSLWAALPSWVGAPSNAPEVPCMSSNGGTNEFNRCRIVNAGGGNVYFSLERLSGNNWGNATAVGFPSSNNSVCFNIH